nr:alpha/beta hydrolase [Rhodopirellula sp. SM50]
MGKAEQAGRHRKTERPAEAAGHSIHTPNQRCQHDREQQSVEKIGELHASYSAGVRHTGCYECDNGTLRSKPHAKEPGLTKMMIHADVPAVQSTISTGDGRGLHVRRWGAPTADVAIVVVHGLGEHSGCYAEFGEFMAGRGFLVYASDQHGHGKSPGVRGHAPAIETFIDDIQTVCGHVADHHPDAETVLLGHSMGGHMVLRFLLDKDRPPIERAIVTNPMILPQNPPTKLQSFAAWLTSKIIPRVRVTAKQPPTQLTQDPEMLEQLAGDPLLHEKLSIGIGGELMSSGHRILDSADQLKSDLLFLIGADDDICDRETSQEFCRLVGRRCTTKLFDGLRHSLLIEKDRRKVYETINQWLS